MSDHFEAPLSSDEITLRWDADQGFEFDLLAIRAQSAVRISGVPIPADGTIELRTSPLELDRLEILFKAQVTIHGEPGQIMEAAVQVVPNGRGDVFSFEAKLEDVETGEILGFSAQIPVEIPSGVPEAGGPRRLPSEEDDLDWEDEATFERMLGDPLDMPFSVGEAGQPEDLEPADQFLETKGLEALFKALSTVDEGALPEGASEPDIEEDRSWAEALPPVSPPPREADALMSAEEEANQFLELLVGREDLEIEEGHAAAELVPGVVEILKQPISPARVAAQLSEWLLDQEQVADLYIDDDSLAELLAEW
jgi:hypothetical protein